MKPLHEILVLCVLAPSLAACAGDHVRWTEEVKLSDGKVIQIQRHTELTAPVFPVSSRGLDKFHEICYPPLGLHWKSRGAYQPDIFDIVDGKAYVHVPVTASVQCAEQCSPTTSAIYFVWEAGQWKRITHDEFPAASEWNLLMWTSGGTKATDPRGLITLINKTTHEYWSDSGLRFEQKRFGGKRVNEFYSSQEGCKRYEKVCCVDETCQYATTQPADPISIFYKDASNTCQP